MKPDRKEKILELIRKYDIANQEELRAYLLKEGYDVTQGTVSKDMRALMLTKAEGADGRLYYKALSSGVDMTRKYRNILRDGVISMETAQNLLVIKTADGMAMACAAAIDELNIRGIVGSIAGDDTIFLAARDNWECAGLKEQLGKLLQETGVNTEHAC